MRLLLVDDHLMFRAGLVQILRRIFSDLELGEANSAREALNMVVDASWDLVLLDIELPDRSGLDLLEDIRLAAPSLPVLMLSGQLEEEFGIQALKAGASGFLSKTESPNVLKEAIEKVQAKGRFVSPELAERLAANLVSGQSQKPHENLSAREFQILVSIASGLSVGQIATQMGLSVKTVSTYRTRLLKKMDMKTNADRVRYGIKHKLAK